MRVNNLTTIDKRKATLSIDERSELQEEKEKAIVG